MKVSQVTPIMDKIEQLIDNIDELDGFSKNRLSFKIHVILIQASDDAQEYVIDERWLAPLR